jgi:uncharacterized protein
MGKTMGRPRIVLIDTVRGLGVLGILTVNVFLMAGTLRQFFSPPAWPSPTTGASLWVWMFVRVFCESKFITLFSMLFGVSMYLVGGEPGGGRTVLLWRRFGWLAVFGLIHGVVIWYGDVLFDYACCGVLVMALRGLSGRQLLWTGGIGFLAGVAAMLAFSIVSDAHPAIFDAISPGHAGKIAQFQGSFAQSLDANARTWAYTRIFIAIYTWPYSAPLMLFGLGLFKTGFITGEAPSWVYRTLIALGLIALIGYGALVWLYVRSGFSEAYGGNWDFILLNLSSPLVSLLYASLLIVSVRTRLFAWIVDLLAPLGRMAFTNYIMQSVLMTAVFYGGRGLGLFDKVDRPALMLMAAGVWTVELIWSHLWLARFDAGPLEWGWRCLTYNRIGPIRRGSAPSSA